MFPAIFEIYILKTPLGQSFMLLSGSAHQIHISAPLYVRRSENPGKRQCRINGHDHGGRRATPRIFPEPFAMIIDALARGIKIYPRGACYMLMTLYCVPSEERLLKIN